MYIPFIYFPLIYTYYISIVDISNLIILQFIPNQSILYIILFHYTLLSLSYFVKNSVFYQIVINFHAYIYFILLKFYIIIYLVSKWRIRI